MTTKLQAILFDKDGTLFDFQKSWGNWGGAVLQDLSGGDPDLLHLRCVGYAHRLKTRGRETRGKHPLASKGAGIKS